MSSTNKISSSIAFFIVASSYVVTAHADFVLDFTPDTTGVMSTQDCGASSWTSGCSSLSAVGSQTAILLENNLQSAPGEDVIDPETGIRYKHFIMGSLEEGFIQEVYIQAEGNNNYCFGGGCWDGFAAKGANSLGIDPLSSAADSANASANPTKVIVRQLLNDGTISQEFLKARFDKKAKITQAINDVPGGFSSYFEVDMSNIAINQIATAGTIINTMDLAEYTDPDTGLTYSFDYDAATFDPATVASGSNSMGSTTNSNGGERVRVNSNVTAGQYIYIDGTSPGGSGGTYIYLEGGDSMMNVNWENYFDYFEENPWSWAGSANRPAP